MRTTGIVRLADATDLPFIHEWLKQEFHGGFGFINNWNLIEDACFQEAMLVFVTDEGPVAFLTHGISLGTILQTKSDCQRQGIGRCLVEHALAQEESKNNAVVVVECMPHSSVEFWLQMGFQAHRDANHRDSIYMHRLSQKAHGHVKGDDMSLATITVLPQAALYKEDQTPDRIHYVQAKYIETSQSLHLAHRVSVASESALGDQVIEISWGGLDIYRGKAKHQGAAAVGIMTTPNYCGWYLDVIAIKF